MEQLLHLNVVLHTRNHKDSSNHLDISDLPIIFHSVLPNSPVNIVFANLQVHLFLFYHLEMYQTQHNISLQYFLNLFVKDENGEILSEQKPLVYSFHQSISLDLDKNTYQHLYKYKFFLCMSIIYIISSWKNMSNNIHHEFF